MTDITILWVILIYSFVVEILTIGSVWQERHGWLRSDDGKVGTFSVSAPIGILWWFVALGAMWRTLESLEKNNQIVLIVLLMVGSAFAALALSEAITQIICRKLFKDVQFKCFIETLRG